MRVYWAGSYEEQGRIKKIAKQARMSGIESTSRWLWQREHDVDSPDFDSYGLGLRDLNDIDRSDALAMVLPLDLSLCQSGAVFETGYAFAKNMPVIVIGQRMPRRIFYFMDEHEPQTMFHFDDVQSAINWMATSWPHEIGVERLPGLPTRFSHLGRDGADEHATGI